MAETFDVRPLHKHRSPEPGTGSRNHRLRRGLALSALAAGLLFAAGVFTACGGDDDDEGGASQQPPSGTVASTAAELIPDLSSLGFQIDTAQNPGFAESPNSKVTLYTNPSGKVSSLRTEVAIAQNENAASSQFNALADALANPPPGLFGADTRQTPGTAVYQADQSRSYKTDKPDGEGTYVFSDIHRFGRAIVIMYTIGPAGPETENVRKQVAEMIAGRAPR